MVTYGLYGLYGHMDYVYDYRGMRVAIRATQLVVITCQRIVSILPSHLKDSAVKAADLTRRLPHTVRLNKLGMMAKEIAFLCRVKVEKDFFTAVYNTPVHNINPFTYGVTRHVPYKIIIIRIM